MCVCDTVYMHIHVCICLCVCVWFHVGYGGSYRGLWETAQTGTRPGWPIVGVVGAGHVKGIIQAWPTIGSLEAKRKVAEFVKEPIQDAQGLEASSRIVTGAVTGATTLTGTLPSLHNDNLLQLIFQEAEKSKT
jgi:pheromone shutdown protein TraB